MGSTVVKAVFGMVILVLCVFFGPCDSYAASPPDAGAILRDIRDKPALLPGESDGKVEIRPREVAPAVAGPKVFVKGFRIKGAVIFKEETLLPLLQGYISREHSFSELQQAADKIVAYYAAQGYIVRAYLPPQEIRDGIVEIAVIEGRLEEVLPDKESKSRLNFPRARQYMTASQPIGEPVRMDRLERGMLILNDIPGVAAASTLQQGTKEGQIQQVVKLAPTPLFTGNIDFDNAGSRASGEYRVTAGVNLNNPAGIGDGLSVKALGGFDDRYTLRTEYGRIAYNVPVGYSGLRFGGSFAAMDYKLGADLSDSNSKGRAAISSLFASYPLIRQREHNLSFTAQYDHKELYNESLGATTSDKRVDAATLGLSGNVFDSLLGGGYTSLGVNFVTGRLDLSRWQNDLDADQVSAKNHGDYKKATFSLYRMQRLAEKTSLSLSLTHQIAFNNLDSSEEISLGGAYGVRAYPANEATGDEGTLLAVELRQRLTQSISVFGFYDYGRIKTNHAEWVATVTPNSYDLQGAGGGIAYIKPGSFQITGAVADRLGNNPGRSTAGNDSDGTMRSPRFWVTASKYF
jgi:hemolysin activation/secretion protein